MVKPKVPTQFIVVLSLCALAVFVGFMYYYVNYAPYARLGATPSITTPPTEEITQPAEETKMPEEIPTFPTQPIEEPVTTAGAAAGNMTNVTNVTNTTNSTNQTVT